MHHFASPMCSQEWAAAAQCIDPYWNSLDSGFCGTDEAAAFAMMSFAQHPYGQSAATCLALQQHAQQQDLFREDWPRATYNDVPYWNAHEAQHMRQCGVHEAEAEHMRQCGVHEAEALATMGFPPCVQSADEYMVIQEEIRELREQQLQLYLKLQQSPIDGAGSVCADSSAGVAANSSPCMLPPQLFSSFRKPRAQRRLEAEPGPVLHAPNLQAPAKAQHPGEAVTRPGVRKMQTLSASLQALADEDPDCLFVVRRINKLGFKAVRTLKRHFSAHGRVVKVLLAHSTVRQNSVSKSLTRRRPSSLGFVHMASSEGAQQILALGSEHEVSGILIRVQRFERQSCEEEFEEEQSDFEESPSGGKPDNGLDRQMSEESEESPSDVKFDDGLDRQISDASTSAATSVSNQTADSGLDSDETSSRCNSSSI